MKNILITGGCGYIGTHLCLKLNENKNTNYNIIIYDNLEYGNTYMINENNLAKIYKGELEETEKIEYLFRKYNFKKVIHFAGLCHISESIENPNKYYQNNLVLSKKLLDICVKYNIESFYFF